MNEDVFRWILAALLVTSIGISGRARARARAGGEVLARSSEGPALVIGRLLVALPLLGSLLAWMFWPAAVRWAALPLPAWTRWTGAVLGAAAVPLVSWTVSALGRNISETVLTKPDHELVAQGPYRHVRHPLYTAGLMLLTAASLLSANGLVAGLTLIAAVAIRTIVVPREERALVARFGDRYETYRRTTGALLPWR